MMSAWILQILFVGVILSLVSLLIYKSLARLSLPIEFRYRFLKTAFVLLLVIPLWPLVMSNISIPKMSAKKSVQAKQEQQTTPIAQGKSSVALKLPESTKKIASLWKEILTSIYLVGLAVAVFKVLAAYFKAKAIVWTATRYEDQDIHGAIYLTDLVTSPVSMGVFNPVILIPRHLQEELSEDEFRMVLTHESTHINRRDNLIQFISVLAGTIWYFWPVMRKLSEQMENEMEITCDDRLLKSGVFSPRAYGNLLLRLSTLQTPMPGWSGLGISNSFLKRRIMAMKSAKEQKSVIRWLQAPVLALLVVVSAGISAFAVDTPVVAAASISQDAIAFKYKIEVKDPAGKDQQEGAMILPRGEKTKLNLLAIDVQIKALPLSKTGADELKVIVKRKTNDEVIADFSLFVDEHFERAIRIDYEGGEQTEVKLKFKR